MGKPNKIDINPAYSQIMSEINTILSTFSVDSVDGHHTDMYSSPYSLAVRNELGYLIAKMFKMSHATTNPTVGSIMTQVSMVDGYIRPTTPAEFINALNLLTTINYGAPLIKTTSFTLTDADCNKVLFVTGACVITIPQDTITVPNAQIHIIKDTSLVVSSAPAGTTTLKSTESKRAIKGQNSWASLIRKGSTNEWYLGGSLE